MARSRASAKAAGTRFESLVAGYLRDELSDDSIERRAKSGALDRGDVSGVRCALGRVVVECKDCTRADLPKWLREAENERENDCAAIGLVVHKRKGVGAPGEQYVTMTLATLAEILRGLRE